MPYTSQFADSRPSDPASARPNARGLDVSLSTALHDHPAAPVLCGHPPSTGSYTYPCICP